MTMSLFSRLAVAAALALGAAAPAAATDLSFGGLAAVARQPVAASVVQPWMSPEIRGAWDQGFLGQNTTITVIDDFNSTQRIHGNLGTGVQSLRHGEWTALQARLLAPRATVVAHGFHSGAPVALRPGGLNTLNLSYGMMARAGFSATQIRWSAQEGSIIDHARRGAAVVVKAAGNDAVAVGTANRTGQVDYLNSALTGATGTIFVGALTHNGTPQNRARLASYSNFAGNDRAVQQNFLAVGVAGNVTGLHGTSFAAPVVAGYAAVLGSKFRTATPAQIKSQLLNTARTDTIHGYNAALHGRGEASIARALAPASIR